MSATATTQLAQVATNVDVTEVSGEEIVDFDIDANNDYEIQSCVMVDEDGQVVEAAVRFGRVEERDHLGIGVPILETAWVTAVVEATGVDDLGRSALEADMSDFGHNVPHLRVERESVETYDSETLSIDEFAAALDTLAEFVEGVLRGDDTTIDAEIDDYL